MLFQAAVSVGVVGTLLSMNLYRLIGVSIAKRVRRRAKEGQSAPEILER